MEDIKYTELNEAEQPKVKKALSNLKDAFKAYEKTVKEIEEAE